MKRQIQNLGIRNWYGDDFLSLQAEPLKVIDSFFGQYGAFVLSGCEITPNDKGFDVAPGLVVLEGQGAEGVPVKVVVPFSGVSAATLPLYLTLAHETQTDVYHDGKVKPVADIYKAVPTSVKPAGSYVEISRAGSLRFADAIQDVAHRFVTDNERSAWNTAAQDVYRLAVYDYVVDSDQALANLNNNSKATCVLIKRGTWKKNGGITLHKNTRRIYGEVDSVLEFTDAGLCCIGYYDQLGDNYQDYRIEGVTVRNKNNTSPCFLSMRNMYGCLALSDFQGSYDGAKGLFMNCDGMYNCQAKASTGDINICIYCYDVRGFQDRTPHAAAKMTGGGNYHLCVGNAFHALHCVTQCTAKSYAGCYSGKSMSSTYACANTLNGGWNEMR